VGRRSLLGSREFKSLSFKDQLGALNDYLRNPARYAGIISQVDSSYNYIDTLLEKVSDKLENPFPSVLPDNLPIFFVPRHWAAYVATYNSSWFEEGLSPVDILGFEHCRIMGIQLFNFPLLCCDILTRNIMEWLAEKKPKLTRDLIYYAARMRTTAEYFFDPSEVENYRQMDLKDLWNVSLVELDGFFKLEDINEVWPIMEYDDLVEGVEDETFVLYYPKAQYANKRAFIPLIPSELMSTGKFKLRDWGFLQGGM